MWKRVARFLVNVVHATAASACVSLRLVQESALNKVVRGGKGPLVASQPRTLLSIRCCEMDGADHLLCQEVCEESLVSL